MKQIIFFILLFTAIAYSQPIDTTSPGGTGMTKSEVESLVGDSTYALRQALATKTEVALKAPYASPTFTGTVTFPATTSIGAVSETELSYLDGVTSAIQTQIGLRATLASPTFTGTVVLPSTTSIGTVSNTEIGYLDGVTSSIQTQINAKATAPSGTINELAYFNTTSTITSLAVATYPSLTELSYVKGTTSNLQNQINAKLLVTDTTNQRTFSDLKYVDKSSTQTITGQKNFSGTVKFGSDTTMRLGYVEGQIRTGLYIQALPHPTHPYGTNRIFKSVPSDTNTASWVLANANIDWKPLNTGVDHSINLGYNWGGEITTGQGAGQWGFSFEPNYEYDDTATIYEYFIYYNDYPSPSTVYNARPLQLAVYRGLNGWNRRTIGLDADLVSLGKSGGVGNSDAFQFVLGQSGWSGVHNYLSLTDSSVILQNTNDFAWLLQRDSSGAQRELMRITDDNTVAISPDGYNDIELISPLRGQIRFRNNDNTDYLYIIPDTTNDKLTLGGTEGIYTQQLSIGYIPIDTTGMLSGEIVADPNTGVLTYLLPLNILPNGDFADWTGDDPDVWTHETEDAGNYIEESPTGTLHFVTDGSVHGWNFTQNNVMDSAVTYGYSVKIDSMSANDTIVVSISTALNINVTEAKTYTGTFTATGLYYDKITIRNEDNNVSFYISDIKIWVKNGAAKQTIAPTILVPDTTGITDGYVLKYIGGEIVYSPDVSTSGSGTFNPDGTTIDTTAGGLARVLPAKVTKWDSVTTKITAAQASDLISDSLSQYYLAPVTTGSMAYSSDGTTWSVVTADVSPAQLDETYSALAHTHTDMFDTLSITWGVLDTTYAGALSGWKVPNNITITEISAYTDANTCTFNIEERGETTPNTAGTDVIESDLVADTDQQETTTFSNANIAKDAWLVPTISATGDVAIFSISVRYIKTD